MGEAPDELDVYELVLLIGGVSPDEVRTWAIDDRKWLITVHMAKELAKPEMNRRADLKAAKQSTR